MTCRSPNLVIFVVIPRLKGCPDHEQLCLWYAAKLWIDLCCSSCYCFLFLCFFLFCFQAPNPRLPTPQQPGQLPLDQPDGGTTIPPPVPVVGKLTVKGKFDFTSVSHCLSGCPSVVKC